MCVWVDRNYLRVRGEYGLPPINTLTCLELPPRARRIPCFLDAHWVATGTTSACAENTLPVVATACTFRNYLRVRGEYVDLTEMIFGYVELPPRARRIRESLPFRLHLLGTTSACAENTKDQLLPMIEQGNYLRVRGEYVTSTGCWSHGRELPPRARRIPDL